MKITGIILLIIGVLSLIGGLIEPSGAYPSVVIIGYFFKILFIVLGIFLISRSNKIKISKLQNKSENVEIIRDNTSELKKPETPVNSLSTDNTINQTSTKEEAEKVQTLTDLSKEKESYAEERQILVDLKEKEILTEEEYNIKIATIEQYEKQVEERRLQKKMKEDEAKLNERFNQEIEPDLQNLNFLLESNIINNEEFNAKRKKLLIETQKKYFKNNWSYETVWDKKIDFQNLYGYHRRTIRDYYRDPEKPREYLYHVLDNSVMPFSKEELEEIIIKGKDIHYKYVIMPVDFNPDVNGNYNCTVFGK